MVTQAPSDAPASPQPAAWCSKDALLQRLLAPVDIASLVFFRIFFGVIVFWHVWLQVPGVRSTYIDPEFHFSYPGLGWVEPLPGELMHAVFLVMAASAIFIACGLFYRYAAAIFFVTHTYALLAEQAVAWNHYYLISLIGFLLIFVPAHRTLSLDVARGAVAQSDDAPAWTLWVLRGQMGIVYFFAGLAKLTSSDWLQAKPMELFMAARTEFPLVGRWFTEDWLVHLASISGMLLDLLIVPLLLWSKTRWFTLAVAVLFHLSNSLIFNIQVFPWLALAATTLFLPPSWPRLGGQWRRLSEPAVALLRAPVRLTAGQTAVAALLGLFFLVQLLLPLRHFLYEGNAEWTKAGHFHAWRMLLVYWGEREATFYLVNEDPPAMCQIDTAAYLAGPQLGYVVMPDGMVQFARYVADQYEARGASNFQVRVWTNIAVNGREPRGLVDPNVDLLSVGRPIGMEPWLIDLEDAVPLDKPVAERCPDPLPSERIRQIQENLQPPQ